MSSPKTESLKDTVTVLINAVGDNENSVNNVVIKSLTKIANSYPNEVIEIFCEFYTNTVKVNPVQLGNIVKVLEQTCVNQVKRLEPATANNLVTAMLRAMMENVTYEPVVQMGASAVLVAVGHEHLDLVLRSLINQLSPASVPHYTIAHTLGTLAAVNTHGVVPHIKEILSKMLPLLSLVKADGLKQAFAYAFGHFAVAVSEQIGDNVENGNITSIKDNFVTEFTIIFDVLYNQWLASYEAKVSESVLEALGPITRLISERQFNETVNKFVLSLLSLYRKPAINYYYISQCISYLLSPSPLNPKLSLNDSVINSINHVLFNLVLLEPDYDQPHTVKNHFEVLRCFDHMAGQFPDQTIESLLHQCKNNQEKDRMKAVIILTHLTTSSQIFVENYAHKFIVLLKIMTTMEQGIKMKKLLVKAIVGLVYRNCITTPEDFSMVEFIIKHCSYEGAPNVSKHDVLDLHDTCKSSLILMCNTVTSIRSQLRNLLLTALTGEEFTASMATVCHCLTSLLQNNSDVAADEQSEKELEMKCSPDLVFVRCLTHVVEPDQVERNRNILVFLEEYSGDVHKNLKNSWTIEIQRLLKFVETTETKEQWHNMLLDLLMSAVEQVNSNKWVEFIATLISQQILSKKQSPMIKGVSLQYLAVLSCHMSNAAVVEKILKIILLALKSIPMESSDYVSKAVGIASRQHGEFILNELDAIYKENESKRGSKILNFLSSRHSKTDAELSVVRYAVITCYGKVAVDCLDVHVLARLGDNVTAILYDILKSNPSFDLCKASVTTLYEISKALHPAAHHNVALRNRWQLLNAVLEQIYNTNLDKRNVELYPIIVKASKALTKLQKGILPEERNTILRVLFNSIFGELSSFKKKYEIEGNGDKNDNLAKTLNDSLSLLHQLIKELIIQSTCLSTIDDLIGLLIEWIRHENDEIRTASVMILHVIFDTYIKNVKLNYETPSKFGQMGYLLGLIIPGIADTNFPVRLTTIDCIKVIIQIQDLYEGHTVGPDDECMLNLGHLQNNILTNDLNMISDYCTALCEAISPKIPHHHNMQFIESLLEGYDDQELRSVGTSAILDAYFVNKGQDLYQSIERIVEVMLGTMSEVREACSLCLSIEHGDPCSTVLELAPILGGALARHCPQHAARLVAAVASYARCPLPPQRCAALALLGDLLNYRCNNNPVLIETVLATLNTGWKDENDRVRATCLRGAANIAQLKPEHRNQALPAALAALSQGVDAQKTQTPSDNVPLAAIQGLSRLLTELDKIDQEFDRELLSISQKIRPFMNTECPQLREHSIKLFGIIVGRVRSDALVDQGVSSLPCFLLHLCDKNPNVVRASKFTLKQVFKTFNVKKSNDFVQTHLLDEGRLYLDEFLSALLRQLADELPSSIVKCLQTAVNYLHCARDEIKPHPPLLLGLLYAELYRIREQNPDETELDPDITKTARTRLLQLIKDPNPLVRQNTAMALANICLVSALDG
ncbi:hypothetical protein HF086_001877 [Spodoptera exigua]|uniref:Maestro heat-like repeat-containing protein family member 1 n=1 Tax=Spodoptera exigua TaxID=7107 RepID=A0A922S909_SPOEX|nr:hypothetical protein HF086_001877 [Spodoptera exigua]